MDRGAPMFLAGKVLAQLAEERWVDAERTLRRLIAATDLDGLFRVCQQWASLAVGLLDRDKDDRFTVLTVVDGDTGETADVDNLPDYMAGPLWAGRFVTAMSNRDEETAHALFMAEVNDMELVGIRALATMTATLLKMGD